MTSSFVIGKVAGNIAALSWVIVLTGTMQTFDVTPAQAEEKPLRIAQADIKKQADEKKAQPTAKEKALQKASSKDVQQKGTPSTPPPEIRGEPPGQLQPQAHANNGGVTACFDSLARASSHVIDGEHQAFSFWDRERPNAGTFRSVIGMRYGGNIAPKGVAVIVNSPMAQSECDATTFQVVPTARPCSAIQNSLIEKGKAVANLVGLALIQTPGDVSYMLLPTAGDGCAIVSITVIRRK